MADFLHVGCGPKSQAQTTPGFRDPAWREVRFDIDPAVEPDLIGTMIDMSAVADASMDGLFSSHNIEHLYPYQVSTALLEFARVLKRDGIAVITCPDLESVCALVARGGLVEPAYVSPAGPITPMDILYGHLPALAQGNHYMAHRCGFTLKLLMTLLRECGFAHVIGMVRPKEFDIWVIASKGLDQMTLHGLSKAHFPARSG
jgi:hypothetical protein